MTYNIFSLFFQIRVRYRNSDNISKKQWVLADVKIINYKGERKKYPSIEYQSSFNGEIIANLFSNLNSLNIYELYDLSENYSQIGYSTTNVKVHLNKLYSMPIFLLLMTVLARPKTQAVIPLPQLKANFSFGFIP